MRRSGVATMISTPRFERGDLVLAGSAAVHGLDGPVAGRADGPEHLGHLQGELAGRDEDQAVGTIRCGARARSWRASARRRRASCPIRCGPGRRRRGRRARPGWRGSGSRTVSRNRPPRVRRRRRPARRDRRNRSGWAPEGGPDSGAIRSRGVEVAGLGRAGESASTWRPRRAHCSSHVVGPGYQILRRPEVTELRERSEALRRSGASRCRRASCGPS